MAIRNEDRQFQLEMLKLQIKHQHIASAFTVVLSIEFSLVISIATTYTNFYVFTGNLMWGWFALLLILLAVPVIVYTNRKYSEKVDNIEKELSNL